jgi:hypothetical protein
LHCSPLLLSGMLESEEPDRSPAVDGQAIEVSAREGAQWRPFALVGAALTVTQLGFYLTSAALPLYLRDLGAAQSHIGLELGWETPPGWSSLCWWGRLSIATAGVSF